MQNHRFAEWTTSGAFTLTLSRNQVSGLARAEGGADSWSAGWMAAVERKGLVERVPDPNGEDPDRYQLRLTMAGLLTLGLLREAGLIPGAADPVQAELAQLRAEVVSLRHDAANARITARAALARKAEVDDRIDNLIRNRSGGKMQVRIRPRDPIPEITDDELLARAEERV